LFYGPPGSLNALPLRQRAVEPAVNRLCVAGTGKSWVADQVSGNAGFELVAASIAAAEVNRPLEGQAERVIVCLFERCLLLPHLVCALVIDEIDAIAPNRLGAKADASQGKV
jgi:AAA+ superfamily predicted ATPase